MKTFIDIHAAKALRLYLFVVLNPQAENYAYNVEDFEQYCADHGLDHKVVADAAREAVRTIANNPAFDHPAVTG